MTGPMDTPEAWMRALMAGPVQAQAKLAADTLEQLNAPVAEAMGGQRRVAEALTAAAEQLTALAELTGQLARQQKALSDQLDVTMRPYLAYVEWLRQLGAGGDRGRRRPR